MLLNFRNVINQMEHQYLPVGFDIYTNPIHCEICTLLVVDLMLNCLIDNFLFYNFHYISFSPIFCVAIALVLICCMSVSEQIMEFDI